MGEAAPAARCGRDLVRRWSQPHRRYHALSHLSAVLAAIDVLDAEAHAPRLVRLAAWFHDAVYDGRPGDDERASAALAATTLAELGLPQAEVAEVERLVLLTASHDPAPGDANGGTLCDADLSVLGSNPDRYWAYADQVRQEYAHVDGETFRAGRMAVLGRLLAQQPLFNTPSGRGRWESAARRNLEAELACLDRSLGG